MLRLKTTTSREAQAKWSVVYLVLAIASPLIFVGLHITFGVLPHHIEAKPCNFVDLPWLVFNPGHRVQGFTSCLNVMLLALLLWPSQGEAPELAIEFLSRGLSGGLCLRWLGSC